MSDATNYGLNNQYRYEEYEFDSLDCDQPENANATAANWPRFYVGKPLEKVAAIKVLHAAIPRTYYDLLENADIDVSELNGVTKNYTITIHAGIYSGEYFAQTLSQKLNAVSTHTWNVNYQKWNGKLYIEIERTGSNYFILDLNGNENLAALTGLNPELNTSTGYIDPIYPHYETTNIGQFDTLTHLFINSRKIGPLVDLYLPGNGLIAPVVNGHTGPQICKVPVNAGPFETILYSDPDPQKWFFVGNTNFNTGIDMYLTKGIASSTTHLDLNGRGFSVKLGMLIPKDTIIDLTKPIQGNKRVASSTRPNVVRRKLI